MLLRIFFIYIIIKTVLVTVVFCYEKHNSNRMFWFVCVFILPMGFFIYVVFGNSLKFKQRKTITKNQKIVENAIRVNDNYRKISQSNKGYPSCILNNKNFNFCNINSMKVLSGGKNFFNSLIYDIQNAKSSINLEFYIFSDDVTGMELAKNLISKSKQGVKVRIIFDGFGSFDTNYKFWGKLKKYNIEIVSFFSSKHKYINLKINYRNHRKIVVIDGKIAYVGGVNIRDDHMNMTSFGYWQDLMIRVTGQIVYEIQDVFLKDFFCNLNNKISQNDIEMYFPKIKSCSNRLAKFVISGPNNEKKHIYTSYISAINKAKNEIIFETPYLILDRKIYYAIKRAIKRKVKVVLILPKNPDKDLVYSFSIKYAHKLFICGAFVYLYNGFLHSKVAIFDDCASVGSCNIDNRSFKLNFEDTLFMYDKYNVNKIKKIIDNDIKNSIKVDRKVVANLQTRYKVGFFMYNILKYIL